MIKKISLVVLGVVVMGFCMAVVPQNTWAGDIVVSGKHTTHSSGGANEQGMGLGLLQQVSWIPSVVNEYFYTDRNFNYTVRLRSAVNGKKYAVGVVGERCQNANGRFNVPIPSNGAQVNLTINY